MLPKSVGSEIESPYCHRQHVGGEWVPLIEGAGKVHPFLHLHLTPTGDGAKQNPRKENQKKLLLARLATALESYTKWLEWEAT